MVIFAAKNFDFYSPQDQSLQDAKLLHIFGPTPRWIVGHKLPEGIVIPRHIFPTKRIRSCMYNMDILPNFGRSIRVLSPTITFGCFHSHSVSSQSMQVLSPGGDSSCSWVLVCALGHNLDERRDFTFTSPTWGVQSDREYTRLHN